MGLLGVVRVRVGGELRFPCDYGVAGHELGGVVS